MKKFSIILLVVVMALGAALPFSSAQDAPEGTWRGTWPYTLPPDHHLNAYAPTRIVGAQFAASSTGRDYG